ncbi:tail protein [Caulobacter phage Sansa]|uniref:Tail protein n=1 Tax=Caulobacter phage Sansa TaxID=1675600 RepID=A0A0K1LMU7_9CAUD|nr:tail protein [Caulobacter phage Sansa]AKU43445.1 tail protein [Caulobacter phage Sansa]
MLADCLAPEIFEPSEASLTVPNVTVTGKTLTKDGVKVPALQAAWSPVTNPYVTDVEFQFTPSDGSSGALSSKSRADALSWSDLRVVAGQEYSIRWRAVGANKVGLWSAPVLRTPPATLVSTDTITVGGRDAKQILKDMDINAAAIIREAMTQVDTRAYLDALAYIDGAPVGSVVVHEITRTDDLVETIDIIGVKTPDRTAFILNTDLVYTSGTKTLAQTFTDIRVEAQTNLAAAVTTINQAIIDGDYLLAQQINTVAVQANNNLSAAVSTLNQAIINGDNAVASQVTSVQTTVNGHTSQISSLFSSINGIRAEAVLSLNVDGHITGWSLINDGNSGSFVVVADEFGFVDPGGGSPTFPISYSGGLLRMLNVAIDTLVVGSVTTSAIGYNAVTVPSIASASWTMSGSGFFQSILSTTVSLTQAGWVRATAAIAQHFPSGDRNWEFRLYINYSMAFDCYGANGQDSIALSGAVYCGAGAIPVEIQWSAHSSVTIDYRTCEALGVMR